MVPTCSAVKASCTSLMSISFPTNPGSPLAIHFDIRIKIIPGTYLVPPHDRISSNLWTRAVSIYGTSGTGCVSVVRPRAELEYKPSWRSVVNCSCILGLNRERAEKSVVDIKISYVRLPCCSRYIFCISAFDCIFLCATPTSGRRATRRPRR